MIDTNDVLTLIEAADFLRCHPKTLRKMATANKLPAKRIGSLWRFSRTKLIEWLQTEN